MTVYTTIGSVNCRRKDKADEIDEKVQEKVDDALQDVIEEIQGFGP